MKRILLAAALSLFVASAFAAPVTYDLDSNHTHVLASWSHFGFSLPIAHFGQVDGTLVYDADNVAASSVQVTLPLAGLEAIVRALNEQLRSAEFFDAVPDDHLQEHQGRSRRRRQAEGHRQPHGQGQDEAGRAGRHLQQAGEHPIAKRTAIGFDATTTVKRADLGLGRYAPNANDLVKLHITTEALVPKPNAA